MIFQDWQALVARKRADVARQIPQEWRVSPSLTATLDEHCEDNVLGIPARCGILTSRELEITENYSAVELLKKLSTQELSAYEVTLAFCKRAAIAHQLVSQTHHRSRE
jgi:amidase